MVVRSQVSVFTGRAMAEEQVLVVLATFPDLVKARQIGTLMVEMQLAACVNLLPGAESIYQWEGKLCREAEVLAVFKVARGREQALSEALVEAHPYEVPEVLVLPVEGGNETYLRWVAGQTGG
jgi:periplasmic divalent cation tolerance protein